MTPNKNFNEKKRARQNIGKEEERQAVFLLTLDYR